jgi:hypothetical protein
MNLKQTQYKSDEWLNVAKAHGMGVLTGLNKLKLSSYQKELCCVESVGTVIHFCVF